MASELCITKDALLQPPATGIDLTAVQETPPFTMSGSPLTIPPQSLKGLTEFRRLPKATKDTSNMKTYFSADNYYTVNLATENISGSDPNTTLRFKNQNYTLTFMAIHSSIWGDTREKGGDKFAELSLLFTSAKGDIFHICRPIAYINSEEFANPFINAWLTQPSSLPAGFTMNEFFNYNNNIKNPKLLCFTLEYCLLYNYGKILKPYTLCYFSYANGAIPVNKLTLPKWLAEDPLLTNPQTVPGPNDSFKTYRRKTFDEIFNFFMRGVINVYIYDNPDPYLIGTEKHFDGKKKQSATKPTFFLLSLKVLLKGSGMTFKDSSATQAGNVTLLKNSDGKLELVNNNSGNNARGLKNVKCYPIDLVSQVDSDGNIFIDEKTNKPINIKDVVADDIFNVGDASGSSIVFDASQNIVQTANLNNTQSSIRFIIAFSIIFLILISIIIFLVVYIFGGNPFASAATAASAAVTPPPPIPS